MKMKNHVTTHRCHGFSIISKALMMIATADFPDMNKYVETGWGRGNVLWNGNTDFTNQGYNY